MGFLFLRGVISDLFVATEPKTQYDYVAATL